MIFDPEAGFAPIWACGAGGIVATLCVAATESARRAAFLPPPITSVEAAEAAISSNTSTSGNRKPPPKPLTSITFKKIWRTRHDSNVRPLSSEGSEPNRIVLSGQEFIAPNMPRVSTAW
jgi:hypothetical protein